MFKIKIRRTYIYCNVLIISDSNQQCIYPTIDELRMYTKNEKRESVFDHMNSYTGTQIKILIKVLGCLVWVQSLLLLMQNTHQKESLIWAQWSTVSGFMDMFLTPKSPLILQLQQQQLQF